MFGIIGYVGETGGGKTMSLVYYLESVRKKYGDSVYIATNFFYKNQDFEINSWRDLLPERDKPTIFAYDELQNEFNSRDYKNFPESLMYLLTQNRKGNGKQIVYSVQDYGTVDVNFRRLSLSIVSCRTRFGRLTRCKYFTREQYENLMNASDIRRRMKIRPYRTLAFVQTDAIRELYDSYAMIESVKKKEYLDKRERLA